MLYEVITGTGEDIVVDKSTGDAYVVGTTGIIDFPQTTGGFQSTSNGMYEIIVFKLNANGTTLDYATYLGGTSDDFGYGIALGPDGSVYITGRTLSLDFPTTTGAYDESYNFV